MKVGNSVQSLGRGDYSFNELSQKGKVVAEYIWIGGSGLDIRAKARVLDNTRITDLAQLPEWNYDGSSCYQAQTENSEVLLKPVCICRDPFRRGDNIIVLCESYVWENDTY